jgi:hypothetical protein
MAVGLPLKTTYANGDVYSASDVNDTNGTLNVVGQTTNFYAAKNKIINGDFRFNQRAFTSNTADNSYNFDRWQQGNSGTTGTLTVTPQTFTPGTAPVSGYEGVNFVQLVTASGVSTNTQARISQSIEDVRTLAGQTATISFWAKANTGTPKIGVLVFQDFGTGGSPSSRVNTPSGAVTLSTSWARYSVTVSIPSISGKTLGTTANTSILGLTLYVSAGSDFNTLASSIGLQNATFQIWGVQAEAGSNVTAFQTCAGTIGGELALCQRYYERRTAQGGFYGMGISGRWSSTTGGTGALTFAAPKRTNPSVAISNLFAASGTSNLAITSVAGTYGSGQLNAVTGCDFGITVASGATNGYATTVFDSGGGTGYIEFNAEF